MQRRLSPAAAHRTRNRETEAPSVCVSPACVCPRAHVCPPPIPRPTASSLAVAPERSNRVGRVRRVVDQPRHGRTDMCYAEERCRRKRYQLFTPHCSLLEIGRGRVGKEC